VGVTQIALAGVRYSTGKIDHEFLIFVVPVVMSFAGWGNALSVDALPDNAGCSRRRASGPALAYLALLVGLTFFTSGFVKALSGWMDPGAAATRGYVLIFRQDMWSGGGALNTMLREVIGSLWLWKVMDYATVVFEMAVLASVVRPAWFRAALTGALGFHLGVAALLRIDFSWLLGCYLPFLFSPAPETLGGVRRHVDRGLARIGRWGPAVVVAVGGVYWLLGQRRGYPALLQTWPSPLPRSLGVGVLAATFAYVAWRDWFRPGRRVSAVGGPTEPGPGEVRSVRRRIVFLLTGLMLPAQLACMVWVSEPYPAPVGPPFAGNPDVGGRAQNFRQELAVMEAGRAIRVDEVRLLGVPWWYARNITGFRFPLEPASVARFPVSRQAWYENLITHGNSSKFRALAFHGVRDRLSEPERAYLARRFPRAERLEVSWWREEIRIEGGRQVIDLTPVNAYSVTLR
jgi:hypothetical protein